VDNNSDFGSPEVNVSGLAVGGYTTATLTEGTYYWRVKAVDEVANESPWPESWSFTVDTTAPLAPTLLSPGSGARTNDNTPSLDWSDVTDPSGVSYSLQVDNNSDFGSPEVNVSGLAVSGYTTATLAEGTYCWRVKAIDGVANESPWSESWSFTVDTTAPLAPTLLSPGSGVRTNDNTPSLDWSDVTDPSGVSYSLQIDDNGDFSSPTISKEELAQSTYTIAEGEALSKGTYYWRVKAVDGVGNTAGWADSFSFTEKRGEAGSCGCSSGTKTSTSELSIGLGTIGFCWGTGFYFVKRANRRRNTKS
jgi:predicted phage tail protein